MNKELLKQTVEIFDTEEKWDAFFEIQNEIENITNYWLKIGARALRSSFQNDPKWKCEPWAVEERDTHWYLSEFGSNSVGIGIGWPEVEMHLFLPTEQSEYRLDEARRILQTLEFAPLLQVLSLKIDSPRGNEGSLAFNSSFNPINGETDRVMRQRLLAWAAGHPEDSKYVDRMGAYIRQLTANTELTALFRKFNRQVREASKLRAF